MSKSTAARIAELKRVGYPFNPTRSSNWFGGILSSLKRKNRPTDRIDLLAARTLKEMEIVTRGKRREFILRQVEIAIVRLCAMNILMRYTPDRVRLLPDASERKLNRWLDQKPLPWEDEAKEAESGTSSSDEESGTDEEMQAALSAQNDGADEGSLDIESDDEDEQELALSPAMQLPRLIGNQLQLSEMAISDPGGISVPSRNGDDSWTPETDLALSRLLPQIKGGETDSPSLDQSHIASGVVEAPLHAFAGAIVATDPSMKVHVRQPRLVSLRSIDGCEIDLERRRNGEIRVFVCFPEGALHNVLRHIGSSWSDLVVGIDAKGRFGAQRTFPMSIRPTDLATRLLDDVQILDDAAAR